MEILKDFFKPEIIWIIAGVILFLLEIAAPGFILGFFGAGAIIVGILSALFDMPLEIQIILFLAVSIGLLAALRKYMKNTFLGSSKSGDDPMRSENEFVGESALVTEKIIPSVSGKVEFHGTLWKASSVEEIKEGMPVKIIGKDNITLKVEPVKQGGKK